MIQARLQHPVMHRETLITPVQVRPSSVTPDNPVVVARVDVVELNAQLLAAPQLLHQRSV